MKGLDVLKGVRIVEQGTFITGPCAGMMLADLGADVIKVESPDGDPYRAYQGSNYSPHFQAYNRNKRSLTLDLKNPADLGLFDTLVREADVFIQNFRPGTADRLGAGAKRLQALNPRLVYCSISGFGADGPYVDRPSYDSVAQALSGFLSVVVDENRPRFLGPALADAITGIYAAYGVLGALFDRSRTGKGRVVEVSMLEAMAHFAVEPYAAYFALGTVPRSSDRPRLAQAHILRTSDGGFIAIHLSSLEKFWTGLVNALDAPELAADPRFAKNTQRSQNRHALLQILEGIIGSFERAELISRLQNAGIPCGEVFGMFEALQSERTRESQMLHQFEDAEAGAQVIHAPPYVIDEQRPPVRYNPPHLGEHTAEVLREVLGLDDITLESLQAKQII